MRWSWHAGNTIGGLSGGYTFHKQGASASPPPERVVSAVFLTRFLFLFFSFAHATGEAEWGAYAFSSTLLLNINQQAPTGSTVGFSLGCNFTACPDVAMADAYNLVSIPFSPRVRTCCVCF